MRLLETSRIAKQFQLIAKAVKFKPTEEMFARRQQSKEG